MKQSILIVDDIPQNIQLAAQHLKHPERKLLFATSGQQALNIMEENPIDLVLLDVMMPLMNGYETCERIRSKTEWDDIPVIFLTARNDPGDVIRGFNSGGSDYISKPFHGQELIERVKTHLNVKFQKDQLERKENQLKDLLHILSHDLRNSLSGIAMTMDLAHMEKKSLDDYKEKLSSLNSNGLDILDLVRKMLVLEEKPLELSSLDLQHCLNRTVEILATRIEEKNIRIEKKMDAVFVMAEETSLINSVLMNVLTNAIKFSEDGSVILVESKTVLNCSSLTISDEGCGMDESQIQDLFDIRKGKSRKGTRGEKGSGFGMPLVRKFMNAYGGCIQLDSVVGKGTAITLKFSCPEG